MVISFVRGCGMDILISRISVFFVSYHTVTLFELVEKGRGADGDGASPLVLDVQLQPPF